jgi:uracil-DNA glycosylase
MDPEFITLEQEITRCRRCPRLIEWREKVAREKVHRFRNQEYWGRPVPAFGSPDAELIIVGLAPAAHGGNRTGRMFTGDRSGDWLYEALYRFDFSNRPTSTDMNDGLAVNNCLITAVLRCAPPDNKPQPEEIIHCRGYLMRELELTSRKKIIIALGRIAFSNFQKTWREMGQSLGNTGLEFGHGGEQQLPGGITLIASYHPSQQNTQTGKLTRPMFHQIFRRARNLLSS